MPKRKQNFKPWFRKRINNRLFFGSALLSFAFFALAVFAYTSPSFNKIQFSASDFFLTLYQNYWIANHPIKLPNPTPTPPTIIRTTPVPTPTAIPVVTSEYISKNLGISFYYPSFIPIPGVASGGQSSFVREIGDKVYLYLEENNKPFTGSADEFLKAGNTTAPGFIDYKYVEVFNKDPGQSLTDAIKQKIFGGNIPSQCYITTNTRFSEPHEDKSYEIAAILEYSTPTTKAYSYQEIRNYILSCTSYAGNYVGVSYFMMDPQHSDRFLFISLGQDNIPSGIQGYMWDGTIKVF